MRLARVAPSLALLIAACQASPATIASAERPVAAATGHRASLGEAELASNHLVAGQVGLVGLEHPSHAPEAGDTGTAGVDVVPFDVAVAGAMSLSFDARGAAHRLELVGQDGQVLVRMVHGQAWTGSLEAGSYTLKLSHDGSGGANGSAPFFIRYERAPSAGAAGYGLLSTDQLAPGALSISGRGCPACDLSEAVMAKGDYSYLDFAGSRFRGAMVDGSSFDFANLEGADFSPDWSLNTPPSALIPAPARELLDTPQGPPRGRTLLDGTSFRSARLRGAHFSQASLSKVVFDHADAQGADFGGAQVDQSSFQATHSSDATLRYATLTGCNFTDAVAERLAGQFLAATSCLWTNASLVDADLSQATITQGDFTAADLTRISLFNAHVKGTRFTQALLREANLATPGDPTSDLSGFAIDTVPATTTGTLSCSTPAPPDVHPSGPPCRVLP